MKNIFISIAVCVSLLYSTLGYAWQFISLQTHIWPPGIDVVSPTDDNLRALLNNHRDLVDELQRLMLEHESLSIFVMDGKITATANYVGIVPINDELKEVVERYFALVGTEKSPNVRVNSARDFELSFWRSRYVKVSLVNTTDERWGVKLEDNWYLYTDYYMEPYSPNLMYRRLREVLRSIPQLICGT